MARIMVAWELGAGSGHEAVSLRVADLLSARGHEVVFALHEEQTPRAKAPHRYMTVAVRSPRVAPTIADPGNFAECIEAAGFLEPEVLSESLSVWVRVQQELAADLMIEDFAPTALLAARCTGMPSISLGGGFCIAPSWAPWPAFRHWAPVPADRLLAAEYRALLASNAVLAARGCTAMGAMGELYAATTALLTTWPALDPYADFRRGAHYLGPFESRLCTKASAAQESDQAPEAVAYLRWDPSGAALPVLAALAQAKVSTQAAVPDLGVEVHQTLEGSSVRIVDWIADLPAAFGRAQFAVTHGGQGATLQALAAGCPVLVVPTQAEQYITGARLASLGLGMVIRPHSSTEELHAAIGRLRHERSAFADRVRTFVQAQRSACVAPPESTDAWLVQCIESLLSRRVSRER
jgi:UDP:flavonoid glycosyltransferase YjiC (YdhE family)